MNKLQEFFHNKKNKLLAYKWQHYFDIYDRHFSKFIGKNPVIVEIGVYEGGSLEMWNYYFDGQCSIYGIDINPNCAIVPEKLNASNIHVWIGDQGNANFLEELGKKIPPIDILIDDGGHFMNQQILTFEYLYKYIKDDGIYLCEDLHTSYMPNYGGGYKNKNSFIEYTKNFIDYINTYYLTDNDKIHQNIQFRKSTDSIHYYDSVIVLEKKSTTVPPTAIFYTGN